MKNNLSAPLRQRVVAGALAGIIGGMVHAAVNEIDRRVLKHNADDLEMLGGIFTSDTGRSRRIGIVMHLGNAALFGGTYAVVLQPTDAEDAQRKALVLAMIENFGLYPLVFPFEDLHPHIRSGQLDRFTHPIALVQATLRHLALGYGLGKAYPPVMAAVLRRRS
jgi:hypothetical protein